MSIASFRCFNFNLRLSRDSEYVVTPDNVGDSCIYTGFATWHLEVAGLSSDFYPVTTSITLLANFNSILTRPYRRISLSSCIRFVDFLGYAVDWGRASRRVLRVDLHRKCQSFPFAHKDKLHFCGQARPPQVPFVVGSSFC